MPLTLQMPPTAADWAAHTPASDPGEFAALLEAVPPDPATIATVARNLIAHYVGLRTELPVETRTDIHLRRLADRLAVDQDRHRRPLDAPRPVGGRLQGCCRDHTLFAVAVLRQHGVPARSRVGFAGYFEPRWHHDHVVAEYHDGVRWIRFDPELEPDTDAVPDPLDLDSGAHAPFATAAEVFLAMRRGDLDPGRYGVAPGSPLAGEPFVIGEVLYEVAHRYGDEVLLWDVWGALIDVDHGTPGDAVDMIADVAGLLVAADAGDQDAENRLYRRYLADDRLRPGETVTRLSPFGETPVTVAFPG